MNITKVEDFFYIKLLDKKNMCDTERFSHEDILDMLEEFRDISVKEILKVASEKATILEDGSIDKNTILNCKFDYRKFLTHTDLKNKPKIPNHVRKISFIESNGFCGTTYSVSVGEEYNTISSVGKENQMYKIKQKAVELLKDKYNIDYDIELIHFIWDGTL